MPRKKKPIKREYGSGSLRKRDNGKYELRVQCMDLTGEMKRKTFSGDSEEECIKKYEAFCNLVEKVAGEVDIYATIPDIIKNKYDIALRLNHVGEQGYSRSMNTVKIIEKHRLGKMPICDIKKDDINLFFSQITSYSNSVITKVNQQLKMAFSIACKKEMITKNIMLDDDIVRPKSSKKDRNVRGYTAEEQIKIVEALEAYKVPQGRNSYKNQILLELYTGMRMGEINALKPENIDFKENVIHVRNTVSRGLDYRAFVKEGTKTYAGSRDIPINKNAEAVLRQSLSEMKKNREGLIFYDFNKRAVIVTAQVNDFFGRLCKKADIPFRGQHALRHTFASRCIEAGIQAVVLKNWLGHRNIHITLDTYADVFAKLHNDSVSQLDEYIGSMQ